MHQSDAKDKYFLRNVVGISGVEFSWGLGLPVVIESTFLQLFILNLGASSFTIGLIPTLFFIGSSIFALFSSYTTSQMLFKRTAVILFHVVSGLSLLLFGWFLLVFGQVDYILVVFFTCYTIFSFCIGMTLPVWLNYLVHIFSEEKSVPGIAYMQIAQNCARLISSLVIIRIVNAYSFSLTSSANMFMAVGILFIFGSLLFLLTKEVVQNDTANDKQTFIQHTVDSARHMLKNKNFLYFLAGDFEFSVLVTVISFYAAYATQYCGVEPAIAAGAFVACIYAGAICINFLLGSLGWLNLKNKYLLSNILSFLAVFILIFFSQLWAFFIASFLLGLARGSRMVAYAPVVKKLSGMADSTSYFAIAPILTLPPKIILPLLCGQYLDSYIHLEANAYKYMFMACALLLIITFFYLQKTNFTDSR